MIAIEPARSSDFSLIQTFAYRTWPETYGGILSKKQLDFMLDKFYSLENLQLNVIQNQLFYIIYDNEIPIGFLGIQHHFEEKPITKIHKIYVLPDNQGKGIGKSAIEFVVHNALKNHSEKIILNVNRFNKAVLFYQKMNFKIVQEIDISIGNNYLMEDFIMEMSL